MGYLNQIDASFLHMESERTPMHVAGLLVFKKPNGASDNFIQDLYKALIKSPVTLHPFNCKLKLGIFSGIAPYWMEDDDIEMEYHVRRSALPHPGGEKELGMLIERLHSHPLDMGRPLWEFHIIEGLANNRFALYMKVHHSAIDGVGAMQVITRWLTENPLTSKAAAPWSMPRYRRRSKPDQLLATVEKNFFNRSLDAVKLQASAAAELSRAVYHMSRKSENPEGGFASAFNTPKTPFNTHIGPQRRVATQLMDFNRFKRIGAKTGSTFNDVALSVLGTSLRRYLQEQDCLPEQPLVASVPVSLRGKSEDAGNSIAAFICPLETHTPLADERLKTINTITSRTKSQLREMSKDALKQFSAMGIAPMMISQVTGLGNTIPPVFNLMVSNVAAPRHKLFLKGAELEALYPVSLLFDGYGLNVTMVSYGGSVSMGFVGCREATPSLQKLAVYTGEALDELEKAVIGEAPSQDERLAV